MTILFPVTDSTGNTTAGGLSVTIGGDPPLWIPGWNGGAQVGCRIPLQDLPVMSQRTFSDGGTHYISGVQFTNTVTVRDNTTVYFEDVWIRPGASYGLRQSGNGGTVHMSWSTIGEKGNPSKEGVDGWRCNLDHTLIEYVEDGGGNCSESLWHRVHVRRHESEDPDPHADGMQFTKGQGWTARECHFESYWDGGGPINAALIIKTDRGTIDGITVEDSALGPGNYSVYWRTGSGTGAPGFPPTNGLIRNNVMYGSQPGKYWSIDGVDLAHYGNVDENGVSVD